jgi:hypothetical protein
LGKQDSSFCRLWSERLTNNHNVCGRGFPQSSSTSSALSLKVFRRGFKSSKSTTQLTTCTDVAGRVRLTLSSRRICFNALESPRGTRGFCRQKTEFYVSSIFVRQSKSTDLNFDYCSRKSSRVGNRSMPLQVRTFPSWLSIVQPLERHRNWKRGSSIYFAAFFFSAQRLR